MLETTPTDFELAATGLDPLLWLMQSNDSAYPSGAYAHSFGLEELAAVGHVPDPAGLQRFLTNQVVPALLRFDLPWFAMAHRTAVAGDIERLAVQDLELDAWRVAAETREASRRIGSQRLELLVNLSGSPRLAEFRRRCPRGHHLTVAAVEMAALPASTAARAFTYQTLAGFTAASMKLIRIGQTACQRILMQTLSSLGADIDAAILREPDGWFNPLLEIASLRHARSHARLFIS